VTDLEARLTRRALLGAGVLVVAGCRTARHAAAPDLDTTTLSAARAGEVALLSSYAEGTPDHAAHLAHLRALGGDVSSPGPSPGVTPTPSGPPGYTDVGSSVPVLQAAANRARAGASAAVLASIAASHTVLAARRP